MDKLEHAIKIINEERDQCDDEITAALLQRIINRIRNEVQNDHNKD